MSKNKIYVIIIVLVVFCGAMLAYEFTKDNKTKNKEVIEQQNTNKTEDKKDNKEITMNNNEQCVINFDRNKLKDSIALQNQSVKLSIKDMGDIVVKLYDKDAPKTVENFLKLTHAGYYDCLTFHRIAKGFVIQGGDPTGTGGGGESIFGKEFADELNPDTPSYKEGYKEGVLAMANRGPNTNTSQFFIMLADTPLPKNYTIFGKVTSGMEVVKKIGDLPIVPMMSGNDGTPVEKVIITKAEIVK